jgi:hypothetical protein
VKKFRNLAGMLMLAAMWMLAPAERQNTTLKAAATCWCAGTVYGLANPGGLVGWQSYPVHVEGTANDAADCQQNYCQPWAWSVGHAMCSQHNLYGGGSVLINWYWYFEDQADNHQQQYACDDLP